MSAVAESWHRMDDCGWLPWGPSAGLWDGYHTGNIPVGGHEMWTGMGGNYEWGVDMGVMQHHGDSFEEEGHCDGDAGDAGQDLAAGTDEMESGNSRGKLAGKRGRKGGKGFFFQGDAEGGADASADYEPPGRRKGGGYRGQGKHRGKAGKGAGGRGGKSGIWRDTGGGGGRPAAKEGQLHKDDLVGTWTDSLGHTIEVAYGADWRGPLAAKLIRGPKEITLSLRSEDATGRWACGNAMLDNESSSSADSLVWIAHDGRRSVWRRLKATDGTEEEPMDLLPWLLVKEAKTDDKPLATLDGVRPRRTRWCSMDDEDGTIDFESWSGKDGGAATEAIVGEGKEEKEEEKAEEEEDKQEEKSKEEDKQEENTVDETETDAFLDGARVAAVLDARQVLGADRASQEALSHLLMDHDLLRDPSEDPVVPAADSLLWGRLQEVPRRNVLHRLASFHAHSGGSCRAEAMEDGHSEIRVGRHCFPVTSADVQALLRRWGGNQKDVAGRSLKMAQVLSLYRLLENPLQPTPQRSSLQLGWDALERKRVGIEYELFASPFNAAVNSGHFASRFPHVEKAFGSIGAYPAAIDAIPEGAIVGVNPPFTEGYLDHVMSQSLEQLCARFRRIHLFAPVREAPWRPQLSRLKGASFVRQFWDASALQERSLGQPVLYWDGSSSSLAARIS